MNLSELFEKFDRVGLRRGRVSVVGGQQPGHQRQRRIVLPKRQSHQRQRLERRDRHRVIGTDTRLPDRQAASERLLCLLVGLDRAVADCQRHQNSGHLGVGRRPHLLHDLDRLLVESHRIGVVPGRLPGIGQSDHHVGDPLMLLPKLLLPETDQAQAGFYRPIGVPRPLLEPRHPLHQIAEVSLEGITSPRDAPVDERLENAR